MNLIRRFQTATVLAGAMAIAWQARGQTEVYQLSTPISGQLEGSLTDWGNNPGNHPVVCFSGDWTLKALTETIYLDPTALTLRQVGFVSVQNPTISGVFNESHSVSGQGVSGSLTLSQSLPNGGFSFDTGFQPVVWNSSSRQYQYDPVSGGNSYLGDISISGSYSLTTGNHTASGSLNYSISPHSFPPPNAFTTFSPSAGGGALAVDGFGQNPNNDFSKGSVVVGQETAPNGFEMQLQAGQDDHLDYFNWNSGPAAASLVPTPEPGTYALLGMGLIGLICLGRRRFRS